MDTQQSTDSVGDLGEEDFEMPAFLSTADLESNGTEGDVGDYRLREEP